MLALWMNFHAQKTPILGQSLVTKHFWNCRYTKLIKWSLNVFLRKNTDLKLHHYLHILVTFASCVLLISAFQMPQWGVPLTVAFSKIPPPHNMVSQKNKAALSPREQNDPGLGTCKDPTASLETCFKRKETDKRPERCSPHSLYSWSGTQTGWVQRYCFPCLTPYCAKVLPQKPCCCISIE